MTMTAQQPPFEAFDQFGREEFVASVMAAVRATPQELPLATLSRRLGKVRLALAAVAVAGAAIVLAFAGLGLGVRPIGQPDMVGSSGIPEAAKITTEDGKVFVQTSADAKHLELVLQRADGATVVLASIPDPMPGPNTSYTSVHAVYCPPGTGLAQRYYVVGRVNWVTGAVELSGLTGTSAEIAGGRYAIAVMALPKGDWRVHVGGEEIGGGQAGFFLDFPSSGESTPAGCFYIP
jgi:hypothetical protein